MQQIYSEISDFLLREEFDAADVKLREVLANCFRYEPEEISKILRLTSSHAAFLPSWQPLLNQAVFVARQHGDVPEHIFYGIIPNRKEPKRNTK